MESVLGRYRNLIILVGVLFLQVLGLAVQVKRSSDAENTRLIRIWAVRAITPLERGLVWAQNGTGNLWHNYIYLRGVRAENRDLKQQIEQMRLERVRFSEDAAQAHRLQALLAFKGTFVSKTVAAQVIGTSGSDLSRIVYIDKGSDVGIKQDMAVITADGIVGKVWEAFPSVSKVLLISDQSSGVGVLLDKSRLQGVLRGTANGEVVLERVMSEEAVAPGDTVLTSGGDQIFPKGLPVGTVVKVIPGKDLFLNVKIKPTANLSKLEEVLVVTERQQPQAMTAQDTVRMRAADILSQRLPSVPEKPPAPEPNAAKNASQTAGTAGPTSSTGTAKPPSKPVTGLPSGTVTRTLSPSGSTKPNDGGVRPAGSAQTGSTGSPSATVPLQPGKRAVPESVDSQTKSPASPKGTPAQPDPQQPAAEDSPN